MAEDIIRTENTEISPELLHFWCNQGPHYSLNNINPRHIITKSGTQALKMFYIMDLAHNKLSYYSDDLKDFFGFAESHITFDLFIDRLHPEEKEQVIKIIEAANDIFTQYQNIHILSTILSLNLRIRNARGQYVKMFWQMAPLSRNPEGKTGQMIGTITDYTNSPGPDEITFSVNIPEYELMLRQLLAMKVLPLMNINVTKTERLILSLLMKGQSNKEIANQLCVSIHTIRTHRQRIRERFHFKNTNQLISYAYTYKNAFGLL